MNELFKAMCIELLFERFACKMYKKLAFIFFSKFCTLNFFVCVLFFQEKENLKLKNILFRFAVKKYDRQRPCA